MHNDLKWWELTLMIIGFGCVVSCFVMMVLVCLVNLSELRKAKKGLTYNKTAAEQIAEQMKGYKK